MIGEYDNSGVVVAEYVYFGLRPVAVKTGGNINIVHTDYLSTPRLITNRGSVVWQWKNDNPYGNNQAQGSIEFNLRFAGQYYDYESGLHYNIHRTYNPEIGRYMQSDPIGLVGGSNTYNYVNRNPLEAIDPLGLRDLNFNDDKKTSGHLNKLYSDSVSIPGLTRLIGHAFANENVNGFVVGLNSPAMIELKQKNVALYNEVSNLNRCDEMYSCSPTSIMVDGFLLAKIVKNLEPTANTIILSECYSALIKGVEEFNNLYPNAIIYGSTSVNFVGVDKNNKSYMMGTFFGYENEDSFNKTKAKLISLNPNAENKGKSYDKVYTELMENSPNMYHGLGGFIRIGK